MQVLATNSHLLFVWHENSGQTAPENSSQIQTITNSHGFQINIAANAIIEQPLIILTSAAKVNKCHTTVNIGSNSSVQIIEYAMADDIETNNTTATVINCAAGAQLKHCILLQSKTDASIAQQAITTINQLENTNVASNIFSFGGGLNRVELAIALQGQNAQCQTSCLAFTNCTEVQDVLLKIDHLVPNCTSNSIARGILKDKSITDFVGKIIVHPDAAKTIADLQIKNILCSPKAQANNKPELEIYNDDVRCSHGSSTGQMNEEAIFYMRSRGISEVDAVAMLIDGFIKPAIDSCTIPMIAEFVKGMVMER
jgi:Fe-S cluster assembly protein SufD